MGGRKGPGDAACAKTRRTWRARGRRARTFGKSKRGKRITGREPGSLDDNLF